MKLVLTDIYGNQASLDFTVVITTLDPGYSPCYSDPTVVKKPFALDHIYVVGSLWRHKIHVPNPRTADRQDCSKQIKMSGLMLNALGEV